MIVKMYDMNYGESILYREAENRLLVDCGAKYGKKANFVDNILEDIRDNKCQLLITHFDEDHYNGIIQPSMQKKFDKIYLPKYTIKNGEVVGTYSIFEDAVRSWTYLTAAGKKKKLSMLHSFFVKLPLLVDEKLTDICCLGNEDNFMLGKKIVSILWPEDNYEKRKKLYADEIIDCLKVESNDDMIDGFVEKANEYVEKFMNIYKAFCNNNSNNYNQLVQITIDDFHELNNIYSELMVILSRLKINLNNSIRKRLTAISSNIIRNMNECSIVFEIEDDVLAFGDVTPRVIKFLNKNAALSHMNYKIIKVQHHGTDAYWSEELPNAGYYLISNSGDNNVKWSISEKYGLKYSSKMVCTNDNLNRCKYYKITAHCDRCNVDLKHSSICIDCENEELVEICLTHI